MLQTSDRFSVSSPGVLEGFDQDGFTEVVENVRKLHYLYSLHITGNVGECPATSQATIMVPAWRGPSTLCPWCQRIPEQCFHQSLDWEGWSSTEATTFSRSHSYGFLYLGGDEVFGVRDTNRHSRRARCPCGRSCSNYSWDTIICTQILAVH